jgi:hypothetical protein
LAVYGDAIHAWHDCDDDVDDDMIDVYQCQPVHALMLIQHSLVLDHLLFGYYIDIID